MKRARATLMISGAEHDVLETFLARHTVQVVTKLLYGMASVKCQAGCASDPD